MTWLASYPKSGNTWLRALLFAYKNDGSIDINKMSSTGVADTHVQYMQIVSPLDMKNLGILGQHMLRPSMLLHQLVMWPIRPMFVKTHMANVIPPNLGPFIPPLVTERAVYLVRDPRDVFQSMIKYLGVTSDEMIENFKNDQFCLGINRDNTLISQICGWSTHVKSWTTERIFPILTIRYEDMLLDSAEVLASVIKFCGEEPNEILVKKSAEACNIERLREQEDSHGFIEGTADTIDKFFGSGGSYWKNELDSKYVVQIERDHREMMIQMNYELSVTPKLEVV